MSADVAYAFFHFASNITDRLSVCPANGHPGKVFSFEVGCDLVKNVDGFPWIKAPKPLNAVDIWVATNGFCNRFAHEVGERGAGAPMILPFRQISEGRARVDFKFGVDTGVARSSPTPHRDFSPR
jgi:hypothetical protein